MAFLRLSFKYRLLRQKLEDQLRLLVGLRQHRDARLFQHLGLRQVRRFRGKVRILNGAARLRQVLRGRGQIAYRRREAILDGAQLALESADRGQCRIDGGDGAVGTGHREYVLIGQGRSCAARHCAETSRHTGDKAQGRRAATSAHIAECHRLGIRHGDIAFGGCSRAGARNRRGQSGAARAGARARSDRLRYIDIAAVGVAQDDPVDGSGDAIDGGRDRRDTAVTPVVPENRLIC